VFISASLVAVPDPKIFDYPFFPNSIFAGAHFGAGVNGFGLFDCFSNAFHCQSPYTGMPTATFIVTGDIPKITISTFFDYFFFDTSNPYFQPDLLPGKTFVDLEITTDGFSFAAAVPEPSTWVILLIGFAGLGFAGHRRAPATLTS
jgi:PEP-CTERM motif